MESGSVSKLLQTTQQKTFLPSIPPSTPPSTSPYNPYTPRHWLEGVNSIEVFEIEVNKKRKVLIFLGENHYPNSVKQVDPCLFESSPQNIKMNFEDWINYVETLLPPGKKLDIFLEHEFPLGSGQRQSNFALYKLYKHPTQHPIQKQSLPFTSFLSSDFEKDIVDKFSPKSTNYQPSPTLRVHLVDVRDRKFTKTLSAMEPFRYALPESILKQLNYIRNSTSVDVMKKYLDGFFVEDKKLVKIKNIIIIWEELLRIKKQIQAIRDEFWRDAVRSWWSSLYSIFLIDLQTLQAEYREDREMKFMTSRKLFLHLQEYISKIIFIHRQFLVKVMDVYCISRILRTFSDDMTSEYALTVTGYDHFINLSLFIMKASKKSPAFSNINPDTYNDCLDITDAIPILEKLMEDTQSFV